MELREDEVHPSMSQAATPVTLWVVHSAERAFHTWDTARGVAYSDYGVLTRSMELSSGWINQFMRFFTDYCKGL